MSGQATLAGSFEAIFERQGIDESLRNPENFFFYTVTPDDGSGKPSTCAGETYAIPRTLEYEDREGFDGVYDLRENGTLISQNVTGIDSLTTIGGRSIIHEKARLQSSHIGRSCVIGKNTAIKYSRLGNFVTIGERSSIGDKARVDDKVNIGKAATIQSSVVIGTGSVIGDMANIGPNSTLSSNVLIGKRSKLGTGVKLRNEVQLDESVSVYGLTVVGESSRILAGSLVKKYVKAYTLVYPSTFKRAKKVDMA